MKRIATGDIHLTGWKNDKIQEDGLPLRLSNTIKVFRKICKFAKQNKIDGIDILGDLYNDKDIIHTDAQNAFVDILREFPDIEFRIISGNHDMSSKGDFQSSAIEALDGFNNVECILEPTILDGITYLPYTNSLISYFENDPEPTNIMLSHFGLNEGILSSGMSIISDIGINDLLCWKLVLLGHYHKPQKIEKRDTRVYYTGNPIHTSWNDKNDKKRFLVYDTETLEVTSLNLSGFTEYRELIIDSETVDPKSVLDEAVKLREDGHKVRVIKKTVEKLETETDIVVIENAPVQTQDRGITVTMNHKDRCTKYLEIKNIESSEHDEYLGELFSVLEEMN